MGTYLPLNSNSSVDYYIEAVNSTGSTAYHPNAGWHTFESSDTYLGDMNGDNIINVLDIVLVINTILSNEYNAAADINQDATVDILDVVLLVNILMTETSL